MQKITTEGILMCMTSTKKGRILTLIIAILIGIAFITRVGYFVSKKVPVLTMEHSIYGFILGVVGHLLLSGLIFLLVGHKTFSREAFWLPSGKMLLESLFIGTIYGISSGIILTYALGVTSGFIYGLLVSWLLNLVVGLVLLIRDFRGKLI